MQKAFLVGLVAAGSLIVGATGASANVPTSFGVNQALPAPATAKPDKKRNFKGLPFLIALGVGGAALTIALTDGDGKPGSP